jgi:hypothetical protein
MAEDKRLSKILREKMNEKRFWEWGEKPDQNFTLSSAIENRIEKIKDPRLNFFTEEFLEEFAAGYHLTGYHLT